MEDSEPCAQSTRFEARLQRLREHHDKCLSTYMDYQEASLVSQSDTETCSPESSHSGVCDDPDVPPLTRTDSIFLTKEYLESISKVSHGSEESRSCIESSGDEYVPPKKLINGSSSEESFNLKVPLVKLKKQKTSKRTYRKKTVSNTSSLSAVICSLSENSDDDAGVHISSKDAIHGSSSEGSCHLTSKAPLVKLKERKRSLRTYQRKMVPSTSSDKDNSRAGSEEDTNQGNVKVMKLQKKNDGSRVYSKTHYCLYCPIHCHKMARHLVRKHSNETAVAQAMTCPLNSKERELHFDLLRNKGDRAHNNEVLKNVRGTLIPSQQAGKPVQASDYMHCINCEALLKRESLWRHMSRCRLSQKCSTATPGKTRIQSLCAFAQPVPDGVSRKVWELVNTMHQDEVTNIIRGEKSILRLGEHLYTKHGHDQYIRQKMREMGRLIQHARKAGRLKRIEDFYVPSNFNFVVEAVKDVAGFDEDKNIYKAPSLALKLGRSLKKIADILECDAQMAESDNEEFLKNLERSRGLYEKKWDVCVSSRALQTLKEGKWKNTPQLLPFTEDVKNMHIDLDKCRQEYQDSLTNNPNEKNWSKLASLTLCEVILLNRRREDEVSKMLLSAFTLRDTSGVHSDLEQKLCQHFQCIEIRGKRNRKAPILLTPDMLSSMEALVAHRRTCGEPDENPFFFSRPEAQTHLRGSDAIRQIARECGAKHPETLSSTKLRKHISTLSTVLNLRDNEMDVLADVLGHDIRVHRQYNRLPEGTLQLAKVPEAMDSDVSETETEKDSSFSSPSSGSSRSRRRQPATDKFGDDIAGTSTPDRRLQPFASDSGDANAGLSTSKRRLQAVSDSNDLKTGPTTSKRRKKTDQLDSDDPEAGSSRFKGQRPDSDSGDPKTETSKRRTWSFEEVHAVEETLMASIKSGKVPGKLECVACIMASPQALKNRSWTAVKCYVNNRITAIQRERARRVY